MFKGFFTLILLYTVALVSIMLHLFFYPKDEHSEKLMEVARITTLPTLSLSSSYMAERIRHYDDSVHLSYPDLLPIDTLDYIYVK